MMQQNNRTPDDVMAKKIRMLRAAKNVSREEFAMYMGISRFSITGWENGSTVPSQRYRDKIDAEFSAEVAEILSSENEPETAQNGYLTCLRCLPDIPTHSLRSLSNCIATLIRAREQRRDIVK